MNQKINSALISVFYKDGLESVVKLLHQLNIKIYSTGGTQKFIEETGVPCIAVEAITFYPSILDGRVKTLHPSVFGGILGKRDNEIHAGEMKQFNIPEIDLVIIDLYPFKETVKSTNDESAIIEKIDIGGPSMIRAAAKNHRYVTVIAAKEDYPVIEKILIEQEGSTTQDQRRSFAIKAFDICTNHDIAISNYFNQTDFSDPFSHQKKVLRYGENPHQGAAFYGDLNKIFDQLHGKELSYNNLVDVDAAINLVKDIAAFQQSDSTNSKACAFAIIKHTNVCGMALRINVHDAWKAALQGDPESAFGGVLITNTTIDKQTSLAVNELFFEVLVAPDFDAGALSVLQAKKNRILLKQKQFDLPAQQMKSVLDGTLVQKTDTDNYLDWQEVGGRESTLIEKSDLQLSNIIAKHLKSNAIALVKNQQLIGKGCGQTSRIDALKQAIVKAGQFNFNLANAVLASDAFFPFDDCVKIAHEAGVTAFIQPGGSIRDKDSIEYCRLNNLVMVITGLRHFKH